jgi:predicted phage terminase large subunit-like protein
MPDGADLDPQSLSWLATEQALIEIDRELVRRGGLRAFVELAWHVIEPVAVFSPNWHIDEICAQLELIQQGKNLRLAMAVPPRHMKSTILAVMFPAYVWMHNPAARMMFISYDFSLSLRDSKRTRELVNSKWFQDRWGDKFKLSTDNVVLLETDKTGYRLSGSVGGRVMGKGADIIVCDDPHDVKDVESDVKRTEVLNFWRERVQSRLNDPKTGAFVVCHQRVGENDVIGDILKRQKGEYVYLCIPVYYDPKHPHIWPGDPRTTPQELLWPAHMPLAIVERYAINLGSYAFAAQFQQLPGPREGGLFKKVWFPTIRREQLPGDLQLCRGWDFAATIKSLTKADPDWTATVLIGHSLTTKKWYILHAERWRVDAGEVDRLLVKHAETDPRGTRIRLPQDPGAAGKAQAQSQGAKLSGFSFVCEPVSGDKAVNAAPLAGQAMIGNVMMLEAAWNDDFIAELTGFPTAAHDDWVDAASQAYKGFLKSTTGILDYYTALLEGQRQAEAEALNLATSGVTVETTSDLGRAFKA